MKTIKGPGIFLAQFLQDEPPFDRLSTLAPWVASKGYSGVQIPTWDRRAINLTTAAESKAYCDDYQAILAGFGLEVTELAAAIQGQLLALHPVYEAAFQPLYPEGLSGSRLMDWAAEQIRNTIRASANMGLNVIVTLSGGFGWPMVYPWPQRPAGLIDEAFAELARRWRPLLNMAHEHGVAFAFELHPGSDVFDGATYELFLDHLGDHPAACLNYDASHFVLQQLDYLEFIRLYGDRIKGFHVKDAEFRPNGRVGMYGGYQSWRGRAGRFRSVGDGQVDFKQVFTRLTEAGYEGWAVLEWECCVKSATQGADEGAPFITHHLIDTPDFAFDDFVGSEPDPARNRRMLGLS